MAQGQGAGHVCKALELHNDHVFVDPGPLHLDRPVGFVHVQGLELAKELRRVGPGLDLHLAHQAVDVGDLANLQILILHLYYSSIKYWTYPFSYPYFSSFT